MNVSEHYSLQQSGADSSGFRLDRNAIELLHIGACCTASFLALGIMQAAIGPLGWVVATGVAMIQLVALLVARTIANLVADLYRQMEYRERFLVFLAHLSIVIVPWTTGLATLPTGLMGLLLVLSFQCMNPAFLGRLYAIQWLMVFLGCLHTQVVLSGWLPMGFTAASLCAMRFGHLRFRLGRYARVGLAVPMDDALQRTIWRLVPVLLVGACVWFATSSFMAPRSLRIDLGGRRGPLPPGGLTLSVGQMFWSALLIIGIIVGLLVSLNLLEKFLRKRQQVAVPPNEPGGMAQHVVSAMAVGGAGLVEDTDISPRQRIITACRQLAERMAIAGQAPVVGETIAAWLQRLTAKSIPAETFDKACYSTEPIDDETARAFVDSTKALAGEISVSGQ